MPRHSEKRRRRTPPAQIQKTVADFRRSGLTRRAFSQDRGIPTSTLDYWLRRYRPSEPEPAELIPVGVVAMDNALTIELELPGGVILRLGRGVRSEDLRIVLEALRSC